MKKLLLIAMLVILIPIISAEQWRCEYSGRDAELILNKSKYYKCPPVLKEFYRLESQENFTIELIPIMGGGPMGGGGVGMMPIEEIEVPPPEEPESGIGWLIIIAILLIGLIIYIIAKKKKNEN